MICDPSTKRLVGWQEQRFTQRWMSLRVLANTPGAIITRTSLLHLVDICFRRFSFGITSAPIIKDLVHHKMMHTVPEDIEGVQCMMVDIMIVGEASEEHDVRVRAVFRRLEDSGVTLNVEKCELAK